VGGPDDWVRAWSEDSDDSAKVVSAAWLGAASVGSVFAGQLLQSSRFDRAGELRCLAPNIVGPCHRGSRWNRLVDLGCRAADAY